MANTGGHRFYVLDESSLASTRQAHEFVTRLHSVVQVPSVGDTRRACELPAPHLSADRVIELWKRGAEQQIAQVQEREARELSRLDKLIAAAREFAHEVKDRTVAFAKDIKERAGSLFGNSSPEEQAKAGPEKDQAQEQARPPTPEMQARLDELLGGFHRRMEAQQSVETRLADFGNRMETKQQEQAQALARQQQEQALKLAQEQTKTKEPEEKQEHSRGFGIGR